MFHASSTRTMQGAMRIAAERNRRLMEEMQEAKEAEIILDTIPEPEPEEEEPAWKPIETPWEQSKKIIQLIARMHGVPYHRLMSVDRKFDVSNARMAAICAVHQHFANKGIYKSLPEMGRIFRGRDHTTILHSMRKRGYDYASALNE